LSTSEDEDKATYAGQPSAGGRVIDAEGIVPDDEDFDDLAVDPADDTRSASPATKWGMAGLVLAYAGLGSYCLVTALGNGIGPDHPQGVTRSVSTAVGKATTDATAKAPTGTRRGTAATAAIAESAATSTAIVTGKAYAAKAFVRVQAAVAPKVEALTAISATAIGPAGANGDHPHIAPLVLDGNSATAWVTHWYQSANFGNLKEGTGLVLDMGQTVTIRQVKLALGGSPGFWGADIQIRVGDSPGQWNFAPAAVVTDVGGWVAPELRTPVTGRYVQIWFTKLPRDSWGTYQEHVYGVTVHGSVPTSHTAHAGGGHDGGNGGTGHGGAGHGGGHGGGHGHGGHGD
jgi:microcystin-dependent protein